METTEDRFLNGRITAAQPKNGFRAGHDTVLLAAAVPAMAGDRVLELGAGVGIASLCLAARVPGLDITGIEIDPELVALANANAAHNTMAHCVRFLQGDVLAAEMSPRSFDHVFFNAPFHPDSGLVSRVFARDRAKRGANLSAWMQRAVSLTKPEQTVTTIVRADRVRELDMPGELTILPLAPRAGAKAKRAIVQFRSRAAVPHRTMAPMTLHEPDGTPTREADAVLRHATAIVL